MTTSTKPRDVGWAGLLAIATSVAWGVVAASGAAAEPAATADAAELVSVEVFPAAIELATPQRRMQLVVSGRSADGRALDLTHAATYRSSDAAVAVVDCQGVVRPRGAGVATIISAAAGRTLETPVVVRGQESDEPVSFHYGALVALSKHDCNSGACHGAPSGKGGFRLSLRAFDSTLDHHTLVREEYGRRTNPLAPDASLLLAKPMMRVAHGGGLRLTRHDPAYQLLRRWIAEGCQPDAPTAPICTKIEVHPPPGRVFAQPHWRQQLCVLATFSDGSLRDVTDVALYSSSDDELASVSMSGLATGHAPGEAAVVVRYLDRVESTRLTFVEPPAGREWLARPPVNYIDELVDARLRLFQIPPSAAAGDGEFFRRVHLDLVGALPSVEATRTFLADDAADKRARLIDRLLADPAHARYWALQYGDLLRMTKSVAGDHGVHKYFRWVEQAFARNMPYDEFARRLITAEGSSLVNPEVNFYRAASDPTLCVENFSQVFLGARLQCAKCHNHPFERWTQDNYYGLAAFFARLERTPTGRPDEVFVWTKSDGEVTQPRTGRRMAPWLPGEGDAPETAGDRRAQLADWLTRRENPFFARVEVNRLWSRLFGRGLIDPIDDLRDTNPPANSALLDALADDFASGGFDRRRLLRTMLNSGVYQTSAEPNDWNRDDDRYGSRYPARLLSAEQLLDAIGHVTGVPERFAGLPAATRATQLPAPDVAPHDFLKAFGQPERQSVCACERSNDSSLSQALLLFNGPLVHGKLKSGENRFRRAAAAGASDEQIIEELYLAALCRPPTPSELETALRHLGDRPDRLAALEDVYWAILNTNEFLFQH